MSNLEPQVGALEVPELHWKTLADKIAGFLCNPSHDDYSTCREMFVERLARDEPGRELLQKALQVPERSRM